MSAGITDQSCLRSLLHWVRGCDSPDGCLIQLTAAVMVRAQRTYREYGPGHIWLNTTPTALQA